MITTRTRENQHALATLPATELVEDFSIYPRNTVFDGHVSELTDALRAGAVLPPIVADATTKRIVDGYHRRRAALRAFGNEAVVEVLLRHYPNEAEMLVDAARLNSAHGRRLTTADIAHVAALARRYRISRDTLAEALNVTRDKLKNITVSRFATVDSQTVVLRRPMAHLAGSELTIKQADAITHVGNEMPLTLISRLITLLDAEAVELDDRVREKLKVLRELIAVVLGEK